MFTDNYCIKQTFNLAKKAQGLTSPNPLVGAVIVKKGKIISRGYHRKAGMVHAEINAINNAKSSLSGATLYINLEPCFHFGRTPPCVDEIIKHKIKKVVISSKDPNPRVNGKSIRKLKSAGVNVVLGVLKDQAEEVNEVFFKNIKDRRPFVVAKIAQSLDGKIATRDGKSKWITSSVSRNFARSLRDKYDCILVGANTFRKDDPKLRGIKKDPLKVVISSKLDLSADSLIVREKPSKLIIFSSYASRDRRKNLPSEVKVYFLKEANGSLPLKKILKILYSLGVMSIFVEGGSETLGAFFDAKLVDKAYFFISPKIIGGRSALTSISGQGYPSPNNCLSLNAIKIKRIGEDVLFWGYPRY